MSFLRYGPDAITVSVEDLQAKVGFGWASIIETLVKDLLSLGWNGRILQVKEKFGSLRFYIDNPTDEMYDRYQLAVQDSFVTCEVCGLPGGLRSEVLRTLCDRCTHISRWKHAS